MTFWTEKNFPQSKNVKYLGTKSDRDLNFDFYISEIVEKMSGRLFLLSTMHYCLTRAFLITY